MLLCDWRTYSPDLRKKVLFFTPSGARFQIDTGYFVFPQNSLTEKMILCRENRARYLWK
jgi:hypothetical protein